MQTEQGRLKKSKAQEQNKSKSMAVIALMTAMLCVVSPFSIPIGPVPVTLGVLAVFLCVYVLGRKQGLLAVCLYLLIGAAGLPVFSGFTGGPAKLLGPTGGYLVGYLPMALLASFFIEKTKRIPLQILGMVLGLCALYALGTIWFVVLMNHTSGGEGAMMFSRALQICVIPFVPIDLLKTVLAAVLGGILRTRLYAADLA